MSSPSFTLLVAFVSSSLFCSAAPLPSTVITSIHTGFDTAPLSPRAEDSSQDNQRQIHSHIQAEPLQAGMVHDPPNDELHIAVAVAVALVLLALGVGLMWYCKRQPLRYIRSPAAPSNQVVQPAPAQARGRGPTIMVETERKVLREGGGMEKGKSMEEKAPALTLSVQDSLSPIPVLEKGV